MDSVRRANAEVANSEPCRAKALSYWLLLLTVRSAGFSRIIVDLADEERAATMSSTVRSSSKLARASSW